MGSEAADYFDKILSSAHERGDKKQVNVELPDGTQAIYRPEFQTLTFTLNGIQTELVIRDGVVVQIALSDPVSGNTLYDQKIKNIRAQYIQNAINTGKISF